MALTIFFAFFSPAKYFSKEMQSLTVYATSAAGLILEILGFLVFIMIEKKAVFGGGGYAGEDVTVDGKPLGDEEHIVVRNIKYEKRAIDFVVIGLVLQLIAIFYGLPQLF